MSSGTVRTPKPSCKHCGAPLLDERARVTGFCCNGCSYVHRLVHEHGLANYYDYKDAVTAPADPAVFQPRDYGWLDTAQARAETQAAATDKGDPELLLSIQGISCAGCVWLVERLFMQASGARFIIVNSQTGELRLRWRGADFKASVFAAKLQSFGYLLGEAGATPENPESHGLVRRIGLCTAFAMNVMLFTLPVYFGMKPDFEYARLFGTISFAFTTLSFLVGGSFFLRRAWLALREGQMHIDLPIALGILAAYAGTLYGWLAGEDRFVYTDFVTTFILLMLIGRWAQVVAVERNQRQLLRHQVKPPRLSIENADGSLAEAATEQLLKGGVFRLAPGQSLPVDARLLAGDASLSLASINGESEPRVFRTGERLPSGALNIGREALRLEALQPWSESLLARLLQGGERQGTRHHFIERIVRGYLIGILVTAFLSGLGWWFATHDGHATWSVLTAILVVSCPCAIGLAFPLADEMAATALRRRGVYVRENDLWAKLSRVRRIIFDKTGTLTLETPELANPEALASLDSQARAALYQMVCNSSHPLSQTLLGELLALGKPQESPGEVVEVIGAGLELKQADRLWRLGRPDWALPEQNLPASEKGTVVLSRQSLPLASFVFIDRARPDAREEIQLLARRGFKLHILSGDHADKVYTLAHDLGLPPDAALGGQTPDAKARWIADIDQGDTLMLGDGANDSLAFDRALCRGTPVIHRGMLEQRADFFYLGKGIRGIRALFEVDAIRRRTQTRILVFSVLYNLFAVGLAIAGIMNPLVAAAVMPLNSLLTLLIVSTGMRPVFWK